MFKYKILYLKYKFELDCKSDTVTIEVLNLIQSNWRRWVESRKIPWLVRHR